MLENAIEISTTQIAPAMQQVGDGSGLSAETVAASQAVASQIATTDWLGPLAPIALSPFFGLAVLSGIATYGPESIQARSALFAEGGALSNPMLFWTMAALALLTSLPRLTKISKPLALAAENIEAYSAVIILFVVRFVASSDATVEPATVTLAAGVTELPLDVLMGLFAALNVIVVNCVKLFFEFLVWLVPFPSVDAILEAANKLTCAGLMGVYCFSPTLATIINLIVLGVCLLVFGWVYRRLVYYREMIAGPLLAWLIPGWFKQRGTTIHAFCDTATEGLPAFTRVSIAPYENGFRIRGRWLWKSADIVLEDCELLREPGIIFQRLAFTTHDATCYRFTHRRWVENDDCHSTVEDQRADLAVS